MTANLSFRQATTDEMLFGLKKKRPFYDRLWTDRIVLYNEFLFWQLVKEAKFPVVSSNPFMVYSAAEAERGLF